MNEISIKSKLLFLLNIKYQYILYLLFIILSTIVIYNQRTLIDNIILEQNTIASIYSDEKELKSALSKDLNYSIEEDGAIVNDNPIRDVTTRLESSIAAVQIHNSVNQSLSSMAFILLPLIVAIIIINWYNMDYKFRIEKLFLNNNNIKKVVLSDIVIIGIISMLSVLLFILIYTITNHLFNLFFPISIQDNIILSNSLNDIKATKLSNNSLLQYFVLVSLTTIISLIGYSLTKIFKNGVIGSIVIIVYMMMLPILGRYDLKNIYLGFFSKVFNTNASTFQINQYYEYNIMIAIFLLILYSLILIVMTMIILRKQSKYY